MKNGGYGGLGKWKCEPGLGEMLKTNKKNTSQPAKCKKKL
jgi:hypothetical protein